MQGAIAPFNMSLAELLPAGIGWISLDILRCTNPAATHHANTTAVMDDIRGKFGVIGPDYLPKDLFHCHYVAKAYTAAETGMTHGAAGMGFFVLQQKMPMCVYMVQTAAPFHVIGDDETAYELIAKDYSPPEVEAVRESNPKLTIHVYLHPASMGMSDDVLQAKMRAHLTGTGLYIWKAQRLAVTGGYQGNTERFEFEIGPNLNLGLLKRKHQICLNGDATHKLDFTGEFCTENDMCKRCLKFIKMKVRGLSSDSYCEGHGDPRSDGGERRAHRKRAGEASAARRDVRRQRPNPFAPPLPPGPGPQMP